MGEEVASCSLGLLGHLRWPVGIVDTKEIQKVEFVALPPRGKKRSQTSLPPMPKLSMALFMMRVWRGLAHWSGVRGHQSEKDKQVNY